MTEIRCRCGGNVRYECLSEVPPPPGAILATVSDPPEEWQGWVWICESCGDQVGVTFDYGTLDLELVRDEQLSGYGDFEILS